MENPFRFFGINPTLIIHSNDLRSLLFETQKRAQLDLDGGEILAEKSNIAFKNLQNPDSRVISFIQYYKPEFPWASEKLNNLELMEFMELSDKIEMAVSENSNQLKESLHSELESYKNQLLSNLSDLNEMVLNTEVTENYPFKELSLWIHRYKYYQRLKKNLEGEIEI